MFHKVVHPNLPGYFGGCNLSQISPCHCQAWERFGRWSMRLHIGAGGIGPGVMALMVGDEGQWGEEDAFLCAYFLVFFITYSSGFLWKVNRQLVTCCIILSHGFVCCFVWGGWFLAVRKNGRKLNWLNSSTCLYGVIRLVWRLAIQLFSCW